MKIFLLQFQNTTIIMDIFQKCKLHLNSFRRFFTAKKKALTKSLAAALLKNGRAPLKGCYSEKTGKTYDAVVLLEDDGQRAGYKMVFDND